MRTLAMRKWIFFAASILCATGAAAALTLRFPSWGTCFSFAAIAGGIAGAFFFAAHKKHAAARGIAESAIIRIQPAVLCAESDHERRKGARMRENSAAYISCFGILLGATVVRFNQDGIRLKNMEIGKDYISFDYEIPINQYGWYGSEKEKQSVRLLYARPDGDELAGIVERFRYETGVVPAVVG